MYAWNHEKERLEAEAYLLGPRQDFVATYMNVANLQFIIKQHPAITGQSTVEALVAVLSGGEHDSQRQVFFLYKKAADGLGDLMQTAPTPLLAEAAKTALVHILTATSGKPCRAAAEALGRVPLKVEGPRLPEPKDGPLSAVSWGHLLTQTGFTDPGAVVWKGRNLLIYGGNHGRVLVLKMARRHESPSDLAREALWMDFLGERQGRFPDVHQGRGPVPVFEVPLPVRMDGCPVFRIADFWGAMPHPADASTLSQPPKALHPQALAVGFTAPKAYFQYPNEPGIHGHPREDAFYDMMGQNAWLLGRLAAAGVIHTAPIPLFHNRVQRERRNDQGIYQWPRAGRLDQWLHSCRYPNIGQTGLRDFEHFVSFSGPPRRLYEHIGTHILSLVLVAGSYFRNKTPALWGWTDRGDPVDARHLFDKALFGRAVRTIFLNYYNGFTGMVFEGPLPVDVEAFVGCLIDAMGVDRHMEEILRVAEQTAMSEAAFGEFLASRGVGEARIRTLEKGRADIPILTGPHLGGFNQPISVPELIEFTAKTAALCMADRYCAQKCG